MNYLLLAALSLLAAHVAAFGIGWHLGDLEPRSMKHSKWVVLLVSVVWVCGLLIGACIHALTPGVPND